MKIFEKFWSDDTFCGTGIRSSLLILTFFFQPSSSWNFFKWRKKSLSGFQRYDNSWRGVPESGHANCNQVRELYKQMTFFNKINSSSADTVGTAGQASDTSELTGGGVRDKFTSMWKKSHLTQKWVNGQISNFQYIMHLNTLAGMNNKKKSCCLQCKKIRAFLQRPDAIPCFPLGLTRLRIGWSGFGQPGNLPRFIETDGRFDWA